VALPRQVGGACDMIESEWLNIGVKRWEEPMPVSVLALVLALAALMARRRRVSA